LLGWPVLAAAARYWAKKLERKKTRVVVNGGNCFGEDINWVHYVHAAYVPDSDVSRLHWRVKHQLYRMAERESIQRARFVIANSEQTRRQLIGELNVSADRVSTVYYGIDADRFVPVADTVRQQTKAQLGWNPDRPVLAFVGALGDRRKGFDTLFEAFQSLCGRSEWDVDLIVIGRGAELPIWTELVRAKGLDQRIRFLGFRADVPNLLQASDGLVSPTRYEAYGLGVQEALCCGVPAVVSANAGVAERIDGKLKDLLLEDPTNAELLFDKLSKWRSGMDAYRAAAIELSNQLRKRTWDVMAESFLKSVCS
jgi:glycosyltransferase involved in cell wall biosynthesis